MSNIHTKARDMYNLISYEPKKCHNCDSEYNLFEIDDGMDTVLCEDCLDLSLKELGFIDDYNKGKQK